MNERTDKARENKTRAVAHAIANKQSRETSLFQIADNRPEAFLQRKQEELLKNSPKERMSGAFQKGANYGHPETNPSQPIIQREPGDGKEILDELTQPDWNAPAAATNKGAKAISAKELHILIQGAAQAAWTTYTYHTTKVANVGNILQEGLDPAFGGTGAAAGHETFEQHSRGHVHYTRNIGLAEDYKRFFEGGKHPFPKDHPTPAPAEILQVAIPAKVAANEEIDPDTPKTDRAYRTDRRIKGRNIRWTSPVPLPPKRKEAGKKPLKPGANSEAWRDFMDRGFAESEALISNMPDTAKAILRKVEKRGLDVTTVMQLVRQALRSMSTDEIFEFNTQNRQLNPRLYQNLTDPTGRLIPLK